MKSAFDISILAETISGFSSDKHQSERSLALTAAAIVVADDRILANAFKLAARNGNTPEQVYELILQSYLFLGFPRMLNSARLFSDMVPEFQPVSDIGPVSSDESSLWYERGINLCKQIYGSNYETLKERVVKAAPEVYRWMIVEGYGKVLSRPQLGPQVREICIVAFLMVDFMPKQLHSHLLGALALGVEPELLRSVVDDIGLAAPDGYEYAVRLLEKVA